MKFRITKAFILIASIATMILSLDIFSPMEVMAHETAETEKFKGADIVLSGDMIGKGCDFIIRDMKVIPWHSDHGTTSEALLFATWGHGLGLLRESETLDLRIYSTGENLATNRTNEISVAGKEIWVALFKGIGLFTPSVPKSKKQKVLFSRDAAGAGAPNHPVHGVLLTGDTLLVGTTGGGLHARVKGIWRKIGPGEGFHGDWVNILVPVPEPARRTAPAHPEGSGPSGTTAGGPIIPEDAIALAGTARGAYWILKGPDSLLTAQFLTGGILTSNIINAALIFVHPESGQCEIWIGTADSGIARYRRGKWASHTAASGDLLSDEVTDLAFDGAYTVIAGTREGVSLFRLSDTPGKSEEGILYGIVDGLKDSWIKSVAFWRERPLAGTFTGFIYEFDGGKWSPLVEGAVRLASRPEGSGAEK